MWATLALTAALQLTPAQQGSLALTNVRVTYGVLGQERKDSKLLPGDIFVVAFDIDGLQIKDDGRILYSMGMELTNKEGKTQFKKDPQDLETVNTLGGTRLPSFARAVVGTDTPPGEYTLKVTVTDRAAKQTQQLVRTFEVVRPQLGFVRLALTYESGLDAPALAVPGQALLLNFATVGFKLDNKEQPNVAVEMRVLDENGKPTVGQAFTGGVQQVRDEYKAIIPWQFILHLNRTGKFRIVLKATDKNTGKSVEQELGLSVVDAK